MKLLRIFFFHFIQLLAEYKFFISIFLLIELSLLFWHKDNLALYYELLLASVPRGILKFESIAITSLSESQGSIEKLNFYLKKLFLITLPIVFIFFIFSPIVVKLSLAMLLFQKLTKSLPQVLLSFILCSSDHPFIGFFK